MTPASAAKSSQSGMAVVTAMLLVALAATTATFMLWRQQIWMQQVENLAAKGQADALARAALEWSRRTLAKPAAQPALGAGVETSVIDAQGLFNLNNVVRAGKASEPDLAILRRLLALLGLSSALADALVDAVDADSDVTFPGGAEDLDYLAMQPPRRAPNRPLFDVSSLGRIKGYTPEAIARLGPYVTALPEPTAVNVNSAPAEVLSALVEGLDERAARALVAERAKKPFASLDAFRAYLPDSARIPANAALGVTSSYFVISSRAQAGRAEVHHRALVGARGAKHEGVIWRKEGDD